jgi:putative ABC transport system permease protein
MSYAVGQRTREIGIRVALGAQRGAIVHLILGEGAKIALSGVFVGLIASLASTRFLGSLLFGVSGTDPMTFLGVAVLLATVALGSCYVPTHRAMRVDPMVVLRHE